MFATRHPEDTARGFEISGMRHGAQRERFATRANRPRDNAIANDGDDGLYACWHPRRRESDKAGKEKNPRTPTERQDTAEGCAAFTRLSFATSPTLSDAIRDRLATAIEQACKGLSSNNDCCMMLYENRVGWVERSETQQLFPCRRVGLRKLSPTYGVFHAS